MVQLATDTVEWTDANGNVQEVTRALRAQLLQPYRGQKMSDLQKERLRFFKDVAVLDVGNKTTSAKTKLIVKATGKEYGPYAFDFNVSKLDNFIAQCRAISDADKRELFEKVDSKWSRAWIKAHAPAQSVLSTEPVQRLAAVVEEARTDAEREETARQKTLKDWGFQSASGAVTAALIFYVARFFIVCAVPFNKVHHWAFVSMICALCPAVKNKLPSRQMLSGTWLTRLEEQTREKTEARLKRTKRKKTIIIDGFKDRRGRHCMNISCGVIGYVPYRWTEWFGRRRHTGTTYGKTLEAKFGDEINEVQAIVADNTSSMSSTVNGLFGYFKSQFPWILRLGCCVHVYDLLCEGLVKLPFLNDIAKKAKFIVTFINRRRSGPSSLSYSMIAEPQVPAFT